MSSRRLVSPACERNRDPILRELQRLVVAPARVLEIACGTGMHAVHFAAGLREVVWQPTDPTVEAVESTLDWMSEFASPGLRAPLLLDVHDTAWPAGPWDLVFCANMIHIAPWSATEALFFGASRVAARHARLVLYGPMERDEPLEPSNVAFDESLRSRNPEWGIRRLTDVLSVASAHGFGLEEDVAMPANNRLVVFRARQ